MPNYHRANVLGATYFFTVVTGQRRQLLATAEPVAALRQSVADVRRQLPFRIDAWVVLPDHMHAIWTLPANDADFSTRWGRIKADFSRHCGLPHTSMAGQNAGLWQPRFWEHLIRDKADLSAHMDYTHYNPVKHGYVRRVIDWRYSSFHRCVRQGIYAADWGSIEPDYPQGSRFGE